MGITPPRHHGHDAVKALEAMIAGDAKALICLGGNFAVAMPDHERAFPAMRALSSAFTSAPSSTAHIS